MTNRTFTTRETAEITGINWDTLRSWKRRGVFRPTTGDTYAAIDVLAICIGKVLRGRGFGVLQSGRVVNYLFGCDLESLKTDFLADRIYLAVVGGNVCPRLLTESEVRDSSVVDLPSALTAGVQVAVINMLDAFKKMLQHVERKNPPQSATMAPQVVNSPPEIPSMVEVPA